jgi:hypothetical protein
MLLLALLAVGPCAKPDTSDSPADDSEAEHDDTGVDEDDADHPDLPWTDPEEEAAGLGFVDLYALLDWGGFVEEDVFEVLDPSLTLLEVGFPEGIYVGVVKPGSFPDEGHVLWLHTEGIEDIFIGEAPTLDEGGLYTLLEMAVVGEGCAQTNIPLVYDSGTAPTLDGGICGHLSIAHSLVRQLGVVSKDWDGIRSEDGKSWDPDFLKAIGTAGGVTGTKRTMSEAKIDKAHTADWSTRYELEATTGWVQSTQTCESIEEWCKLLIKKQSDYGDDCVLGLSGKKKGKNTGHVMHVRSATFADCTCTIKVTDTGRQDEGRGDYKDVPYAPGTAVWQIAPNQVVHTEGIGARFWNGMGFNTARFKCYDEDKKANPPAQNGPGTALK